MDNREQAAVTALVVGAAIGTTRLVPVTWYVTLITAMVLLFVVFWYEGPATI